MLLIDQFAYQSKLRNKNPFLKTALALSLLIFCILSHSMCTSLLTLLFMGILTIFGGGVFVSDYYKLLRIPFVFLILSTIAIIVNFSTTPLSRLSIPIGTVYLSMSKASCFHAGELISTAMAGVSCLYFLSLTTPVSDLFCVLKKLKVPSILIELILLTYRFIFILLQYAFNITVSQKCRLGNKDFKTSCISFGRLASNLFLLAFKKISALYDAMEARCYHGNLHILEEAYPVQKRELFFTIFSILFFALLTFITILY